MKIITFFHEFDCENNHNHSEICIKFALQSVLLLKSWYITKEFQNAVWPQVLKFTYVCIFI